MKKALLLVLVFVLVFAFAAPAFAAVDNVVWASGQAVPVGLTVQPTLIVGWANSAGAPFPITLSGGPDETVSGQTMLMLRSNCLYTTDASLSPLTGAAGTIPGSLFAISGDGDGAPGMNGFSLQTIGISGTLPWTDVSGTPYMAGDYNGELTVSVVSR